MKKFVNRERELQFLNKEYDKDESSFIVIYGRRRVGKTALIKEFIKNKRAVYFLATEELEDENKNSLRDIIADFLNNEFIKKLSGLKWDEIFDLLINNYDFSEKLVVVIDEFQYLGKINPAFPSIFKKIWDEKLKEKNIMVIVCGSLINMMESQTLNYSSPLYGRRTGQIRLRQIQFKYYGDFFEGNSNLIELYSVTGGVPKYIEIFKEEDDVFKSIENSILNRESFLYEEPIFLLEREVQDIGTYFSIIKTIAAGNHKLGNIATALGVQQAKLTKYLSTLINLDLIKREVPVTEVNAEKSKKGLYFINDNFINFWFKFVYPFRNYIELDEVDYVLQKIKKSFVVNHVSYVYEDICRDKIWDMIISGEIEFELQRIGRWWNSSEEIDIVGINLETKDILFGECKYLSSSVDVDVLYKLFEKSKSVEWENKNRKEHYIIFSKSGFSDRLIEIAKENRNVKLVQFDGTVIKYFNW
ncbi:Archaeal ATPase [Caloramator mitchellensis]|uniref:Archaeal ATPase n=1 Tax=Caloramator mitchellensis TaxID=908809 RepID=A0A0R3JVD4_CALMK|nr:ATP-binding protein [Caloramator mitchellensis]KRQ86253.1 Archaeal ATPase [Caloramator mitchellensis]